MGQAQSGATARNTKTHFKRQDEELPLQRGASQRRRWPNRLGTIRKKLVRTLKGTKHVDYRKQMREMLQTWRVCDIASLVDYYESAQAWRDVVSQSNCARPPRHTLEQDMNNLYEKEYLSDVMLEYKNTLFPVHRIILSSRCSYFGSLFAHVDRAVVDKPIINMDGVVSELTVEEFSLLLKFLYTGNDSLTTDFNRQILLDASKTFGVPNDLETDLKMLMMDEESMDVELVFPSGPAKSTTADDNQIDVKGELVLSCHSCLLAARSPFFRSLLVTSLGRSTDKKIRLVVDESVLPRQYAVVVIKCIYQTCIDLQSVIKWKAAEEHSGTSFETDKLLTTSEIAMELYEIGCFLEFTSLTEGCENIIFDDLSHFSLLSILDWSCHPFGSAWIKRQAIQFLLDNFISTAKSSSLLASIPKGLLVQVLRSDFLQASEEDVLSAVIKWGEWQAAKVIDRQATTMLSSSLTRRSPKRRDVSNESLLTAVSDLLPFVRVKHVLPINSLVLQHAYRRKLFGKPLPLDVCANDLPAVEGAVWIRHKGRRDFVAPRLFVPYYDEAKAVLNERLLSDSDGVMLVKDIHINSIPDMLCQVASVPSHQAHVTGCPSAPLPSNVLENSAIQEIAMMEQRLLSTKVYQNALKLCPDKTIALQVRRHAIRRMGLPDELVHELTASVPDIIEDSSSSSSSKQSTLTSKISLIFNDVIAPDVTLSASEPFLD